MLTVSSNNVFHLTCSTLSTFREDRDSAKQPRLVEPEKSFGLQKQLSALGTVLFAHQNQEI